MKKDDYLSYFCYKTTFVLWDGNPEHFKPKVVQKCYPMFEL